MAFREFIQEFGHRAVYELDIINPRWKEDPSYIMGIICSTLDTADLSNLKAEQKEKFEQGWQEIKHNVPANEQLFIKKLICKVQEGAFFRKIYLFRGRSLMIRLDKTRFNTKSCLFFTNRKVRL